MPVLLILSCGDDLVDIPRVGSIIGTVRDEQSVPVQGATLTISREGFADRQTTSAADGGFGFNNVEIGAWLLNHTPPAGYLPAPGQANPVTVEVFLATPAAVQVIMRAPPPETGTIAASVTLNGEAHAGVTVRVFEQGTDNELRIGQTAANGQVAFAGMEPGSYDVRAVPPTGAQLAPGEDETKTVAVVAGQTAPVSFGFTQPVVTIHLTGSNTFSPDSVSIAPGTRVRWVNDVAMAHTITPDDADQPGVWTRRVVSAAGQVEEHVFTVADQTYGYFCEPHAPAMRGKIVVEP